MKIKLDFVTNSSSIMYLISSSKKLTKVALLDEGYKGGSCFHDFASIDNRERLIEYFDQEPCDWVKRITGPTKFWGGSREWYKMGERIISDGDFATFISVERSSFDECIESLERVLTMLDCEILGKESD